MPMFSTEIWPSSGSSLACVTAFRWTFAGMLGTPAAAAALAEGALHVTATDPSFE